jgi:F0F1-type ATP synthase delta subunit
MLDSKIIDNLKKYLSFLEVDKEEKLIITSTYPLSNEEKEEVKNFFQSKLRLKIKLILKSLGFDH